MSALTIDFKIATPERVVFRSSTVQQITLPTQAGEITVLPNHIPLIGILKPGEIVITENGKAQFLSVSGGFIEVLADKVVVLADTAERAEELDVARAEEARKRAEDAMNAKHVDVREFAALSAQMEKEMARLKVAKKYRYFMDQQKGAHQKTYEQE